MIHTNTNHQLTGGGEAIIQNIRRGGNKTTPINNQLGWGESDYTTMLAITRRRELQLSRGRMGRASCGRVLGPLYGGDPFGKPKVEYEGGMGSGSPDGENEGQ